VKAAVILLSFLLCFQAQAKPHKDVQYQDAVLLSFRNVATGSSCTSTGSGKAKTDDNGDTEGNTSGQTDCSNNIVRRYTVQLGNITYVLVRAYGFSFKSSVLANQLPGTHVLVRTDEHGFYVKIGDRESRYDIVEAK
jgi:hypothetical protein